MHGLVSMGFQVRFCDFNRQLYEFKRFIMFASCHPNLFVKKNGKTKNVILKASLLAMQLFLGFPHERLTDLF